MNLRNCAPLYEQHVQRDDAVLHVKVVLFAWSAAHHKHHCVCADIFEGFAHHAPRDRARRPDRLRPKGMVAYFQGHPVIHTCVLTLGACRSKRMFRHKEQWFIPASKTRQAQQVAWSMAVTEGKSQNEAMREWYAKERKIASLLYPLLDKQTPECSSTTSGKGFTPRS
jgi:hypothetical protein